MVKNDKARSTEDAAAGLLKELRELNITFTFQTANPRSCAIQYLGALDRFLCRSGAFDLTGPPAETMYHFMFSELPMILPENVRGALTHKWQPRVIAGGQPPK